MAGKPDVGGQAVIEGVLFMDKEHWAVAVRKGKAIKINKGTVVRPASRYPILRFPLLRGIIALISTLTIGIRALNWSAEQASGEKETLTPTESILMLAIALGLSLVLFVALPYFLTSLISKSTGIIFNLIDGLLRIAVFVAYIVIISFFPDVHRLFQYHGAEHKTINCYEDGKKITLENVRRYSTTHRRCGTSFLVIVMLVSILVLSIVTDPRWYVKLVARVILIPLIIGISYELLKLSAHAERNPVVRILSKPGLWVQRITTSEPDDSQIKVSMQALAAVLQPHSK